MFKNPVDFIKADNNISKEGIEYLRNCMKTIEDDYTTLEIFKKYLKDEEDDMYWQEEQLNLMDIIGVENWIIKFAI